MRSHQDGFGFLPRVHLSRPRLLQQLALATQGKLTVVCANAGYGKTSLVTEFLSSSDLQAQWLHLTAADRDITRLADGLDNCLRRLELGSEAHLTRRFRSRQNQSSSVGVLLLVSRSAPRFQIGKLMARQEVSTLGEDELAFTWEETSDFLRHESGIELEDAAVALVHDRTEGWAAGIAMVSQALRYGRRDRVMSVLADPVASASLVYDYLADEVFDREEPSIQQFLVRTSLRAARIVGRWAGVLTSLQAQLQ